MITTATAKGRRPYQEDRILWSSVPEGTLFGVFDGHGGDEVAAFLAAELPKFWSAIDGDNYEHALHKIFVMAALTTQEFHAGSTASVVFIPADEQTAYVAVLGDSPVLAERADGTIFIGPDHNARSNQEERSMAIARGGIYQGGYMWSGYGDNASGLQMTRALGDSGCRNFLSRAPEVFTVPLGDWLLIASDGLLDPTHTKLSPMDVVIKAISEGQSAKQLVAHATRVPTNDNATAVLWRRN